jgi:SagB-type dehydrogenase family enzyme
MRLTQYFFCAIFITALMLLSFPVCGQDEKSTASGESIKLPDPAMKGKKSFEECVSMRRSLRSFSDAPVSIENISQLLWCAQGITNEKGFRTVPSAGALYPLEIYLVINCPDEKLNHGIYHYRTTDHSLELVKEGDFSQALGTAALKQPSVTSAPVNIVVFAYIERTAKKYKERATQYVHIEVGSVCQNLYLQCESLGLGTVAVGAFFDENVRNIFELDENATPLLIMPVGHRI